MSTRTQILVRGIVQGVGFRPFVFSAAQRRALKGQVLNNTTGVLIDIEGEDCTIEEFIKDIKANSPPLSLIESVERSDNLDLAHYHDFRIVESSLNGRRFTPISADIATCRDCLRELFDPHDRRYQYPFINCTNCGPRFTIIESIPYDRAQTTMRAFEMCAECRVEYENPLDRRFHAEPTACAVCGPQLFLFESGDEETTVTFRGGRCPPAQLRDLKRRATPASKREECADRREECADVVNRARSLLLDGKIVAIKGVGGFHLACDALNAEAVGRLRQRKYREDKPFAMMANSIEVIRKYCLVSKAEEDLLACETRPVVLLKIRKDAAVPEAIAQRMNTLGFMLPYSPLHSLLLSNLERPLVMTSGNVSDEPICYEDNEGIQRLSRIADYFLLHDRRIHLRTDDSVTRVHEGRPMILRRSRGYAPAPIRTAFKFEREILACGAELKNTFCLTRENYAFISHHIGDLENLETLRSFTDGIEHFKCLFHLNPKVVAYDLHPEYLSTKHALGLDSMPTKVGVQHHHAHIASCMADNRIEGDVIGVAMDGLGFGTDGRMWGGEFFVANFLDAERVAHLDYVQMPGGEKAVRGPWRMTAMYLQRTFGDDFLELNLPFVQKLDRRAWKTLRQMAVTGLNSPQTSSMGRLFDAVSSLLGLREAVNYEGQAAIQLETIAARSCTECYEFEIDAGEGVIKTEAVIRQAVADLLAGVSPPEVSARFHNGVAKLIATVSINIRNQRRLNRVVMSGGVFQNMYLLERVCRLLKRDGFEVFTHSRVPTNDGGISLGQAMVANARLASGRS